MHVNLLRNIRRTHIHMRSLRYNRGFNRSEEPWRLRKAEYFHESPRTVQGRLLTWNLIFALSLCLLFICLCLCLWYSTLLALC